KHGLTSKSILLPHESKEDFQALLDSYVQQFRPVNAMQSELVQSLAIIRWRLNRIAAFEKSLFELQVIKDTEEFDEKFGDASPVDRLAWSFKELVGYGTEVTMMLRYESTLNRIYHRTLAQLRQLQSATNTKLQNEPKPPATQGKQTPAPVVRQAGSLQ